MIAKKLRLKEKEVKKVLQKGKPFFSYGIVVNSLRNSLGINRFAIVIGGKSVNTNVTRVFFRRRFYDAVRCTKLFNPSPSVTLQGLPLKKEEGVKKEVFNDYVFVVKKKLQLDRQKVESIKLFDKDLKFLLKKIK